MCARVERGLADAGPDELARNETVLFLSGVVLGSLRANAESPRQAELAARGISTFRKPVTEERLESIVGERLALPEPVAEEP